MNHYFVKPKDNQLSLPIAIFSDIAPNTLSGRAFVEGTLANCYIDNDYIRTATKEFEALYGRGNLPCKSIILRDTDHVFHDAKKVGFMSSVLDQKKTDWGFDLTHTIEYTLLSSVDIDELVIIVEVNDAIRNKRWVKVFFDKDKQKLIDIYKSSKVAEKSRIQ